MSNVCAEKPKHNGTASHTVVAEISSPGDTEVSLIGLCVMQAIH